MKKLFIGGFLLLCILGWFFYTAFSPNNLDANSLQKQVESLQSYVLETTLLTKETSVQKTTAPFVSSHSEDIQKKVIQLQKDLKEKTPTKTITQKYTKTLLLTNDFIRDLSIISQFSGNYQASQTEEGSLHQVFLELEEVHKTL